MKKIPFIKNILIACLFFYGCGSGSVPGSVAPEVSFDFSGARGLVLTTDSSNTSTSNLVEAKALTTDEIASNLKKLMEDGTLTNVIHLVTDEEGNTTEVAYDIVVASVDISPLNDIYLSFSESGVRVNGTACHQVKIVDNTPSCFASHDGLIFDQSGNAYYTVYSNMAFPNGESSTNELVPDEPTLLLCKLSRYESSPSIILNPSEIGLDVSGFQILSDNSLIILGSLNGSNERLFRFYPDTNTLERLGDKIDEAIAEYNINTDNIDADNIDVSDWEMDYASLNVDDNKNIYLAMSSAIFLSVLEEGVLSFDLIAAPTNSNPIITSSGEIYEKESSEPLTIHRIYPDTLEIELPEVSATRTSVRDEFLYVVGVDSSNQDVFWKINLAESGSEVIDLLTGYSLLVQSFTIAENGDIYFSALDLMGLNTYLFKFNNTDETLEQLDVLPTASELISIILFNGS